jgi:hypothetical protein
MNYARETAKGVISIPSIVVRWFRDPGFRVMVFGSAIVTAFLVPLAIVATH